MTDENLLYFLMENIYIYVKYLHEWKTFTFEVMPFSTTFLIFQ